MKVDGIAAVVTGGGSGLGEATARHLAILGSRVTVIDQDSQSGTRVAREIGGIFVETDVRSEGAVGEALDAGERAHGVARILVNCAGIAEMIPVVGSGASHHPLHAFQRIIDINLVGAFNVLAQFAARLSTADLIGEERGVIVNTSSIAGFEGLAGQAAYSASKAGLTGMLLPVARELASHKIRILAIAPGTFLSPMVAALPQGLKSSLAAQVPHPQRLGNPEEFARFVAAAIDTPLLNGTVVRLDGACRLS